MRFFDAASWVLSAGIALGALCGCSSKSLGSTTLPVEGANLSSITTLRHRKYEGLRDLYVSDLGLGQVVLLKNKTYRKVGMISGSQAGGVFLDASGNLYNSGYAAINILEFAPGAQSPMFTYNAGMADPVAVSVDANGNVFEGDFNQGSNGFVNEYRQQQNAVLHTCSPGGPVDGVTVDSNGDVFVGYTNATLLGKVVEYKRGLRGCSGKVLGVTLPSFAGSLAIDKHANLLACDQVAVVIEPPYDHTMTLGQGYNCGSVSIDKTNKLAFITDPADAEVLVVDYPSGDLVVTLGSAQGLQDPGSAVDGPNAVY